MEYAAAGVECQKPTHDETTIKLTSIKLGNYGGQRCCFSQPGAYCASSPQAAPTAREKRNQRKPVQNDPKKKESHSKRPKEERKKEFKMKFKQDRRRNEKLATRYKLAMLEKKGRRTEKIMTKNRSKSHPSRLIFCAPQV
jgi:erythromycin esterase-like protein